MQKRSIHIIILVLFVGAMVGTLLGELLGWILPDGVVKSFFLTSITFDLGSTLGSQTNVVTLDLIMFTIRFGLSLKFNFTSLLGLATAYYFLRYFR